MRKLLFGPLLAWLVWHGPAHAAEPPYLPLTAEVGGLRELLGKPLIDTIVDLTNTKRWVLERATPQGASFALTSTKNVGETFDQLRKRSYFAVSLSTCPGAKGLDAKISSVIAWQSLRPADLQQSTPNFQSYTAAYLESLLGAVNSPPSVSNASTMRAPRGGNLRGIVFEFVKGDTTENVSLLDDMDTPSDGDLRLSWQAVNSSFCPKT